MGNKRELKGNYLHSTFTPLAVVTVALQEKQTSLTLIVHEQEASIILI
jgi:hypothetical protein